MAGRSAGQYPEQCADMKEKIIHQEFPLHWDKMRSEQ
jgi:hypothetical protein